MKRDTSDPDTTGTPEDKWTEGGKRRKRLYVEGSRLLGGVLLDLLAKFKVGPLYAGMLRNEGQKLMSAVERFGRVRSVFDFQKGVLKTAFLAGLVADPAAIANLYDELADILLAKGSSMFEESGTGASEDSPARLGE